MSSGNSDESVPNSSYPYTSLNAHMIKATERSMEIMSLPTTFPNKPGLAIYKTEYESPYYLPTDCIPIGSQLFTLPPVPGSLSKHQMGVLVIPDAYDPNTIAAQIEQAAEGSQVKHYTARQATMEYLTPIQQIVSLDVPTTVHYNRFPPPSPIMHAPIATWGALTAGVSALAYYNIRKAITTSITSTLQKPTDLIVSTVSTVTPILQRTASRLALTAPLLEVSLATVGVYQLLSLYHRRRMMYLDYKPSSDNQKKLKLQPSLVSPLIVTHADAEYQIHPSAYLLLRDIDDEQSTFDYDITAFSDDKTHAAPCNVALDVPVPAPPPNSIFDIVDNTQQRVIHAISGSSMSMSDYTRSMPSKSAPMTSYYGSLLIGGLSLIAVSYTISRFSRSVGNVILKQVHTRATSALRSVDFKANEKNLSMFTPRAFNTMALEHHHASVITPSWNTLFSFSFIRSLTAVFSTFYYHKLVDQGRLNTSPVIENVRNLTVPINFSHLDPDFEDIAYESKDMVTNDDRHLLTAHRLHASRAKPHPLLTEDDIKLDDIDIPSHLTHIFSRDALEARKMRRERALQATRTQKQSDDEKDDNKHTQPATPTTTTTTTATSSSSSAATATGTESSSNDASQTTADVPSTEITIKPKSIEEVLSSSSSSKDSSVKEELSPSQLIEKQAAEPLSPVEYWYINCKTPEYMPAFVASPFTSLNRTLVTTPTPTVISSTTSSLDKTPREFTGYNPEYKQLVEQGLAEDDDGSLSSPSTSQQPKESLINIMKQKVDYLYKYDTRSALSIFPSLLRLSPMNNTSPPSSLSSQTIDVSLKLFTISVLTTFLSLPILKASMTYHHSKHLSQLLHEPLPSRPYLVSLFNLVKGNGAQSTAINKVAERMATPSFISRIQRFLPSTLSHLWDGSAGSIHATTGQTNPLFLDKVSHLRNNAQRRVLYLNSLVKTLVTYHRQPLLRAILPSIAACGAFYAGAMLVCVKLAALSNSYTVFHSNGFPSLNVLFPPQSIRATKHTEAKKKPRTIDVEMGVMEFGVMGHKPPHTDIFTNLQTNLYEDVNGVYNNISDKQFAAKLLSSFNSDDDDGDGLKRNNGGGDHPTNKTGGIRHNNDDVDDDDNDNDDDDDDDDKDDIPSILPAAIRNKIDDLLDNVPSLVFSDDDDEEEGAGEETNAKPETSAQAAKPASVATTSKDKKDKKTSQTGVDIRYVGVAM